MRKARIILDIGRLTNAVLSLLIPVTVLGCVSAGTLQPAEIEAINRQSENQLYILGIGDTVAVKFFHNDELNDKVTIRSDARISLQLIGEVNAAGLSLDELDDLLTREYAKVLGADEAAAETADGASDAGPNTAPQVAVILTSSAAQKVYIGGEVARPGLVQITGLLRLLDAVIQVGGPLDTAELGNVVLLRRHNPSEPTVYALNLKSIIKGRSPDITLRPYDVVYLPRTAIAEVGLFAKQYIHNLIPVQFTFVYNVTRDVEVKTR